MNGEQDTLPDLVVDERGPGTAAPARHHTARHQEVVPSERIDTPASLADIEKKPHSRVLVVIPARDEESTVGSVVSDLRAAYACDVLVVSDDCCDSTSRIAREAGAMVLDAPIWFGAWGATQAGIRYAIWKGYDTVVTMDADGQHDAASLDLVLEPVIQGDADVSIGSCISRASRGRRTAWWFFRKVTGLPFADLTSGLRAYSHRVFDLAVSPEATLLDYQDVGVLAMVRNAGARIVEVPVAMRPRLNGKSRIFSSWVRVFDYLLQTAVLSVAKKFRRIAGYNGHGAGA